MALPHHKPDVLPEISLPRRVTGVGTLIRGEASVPVAAFTLERQAYQTDQAWQFVAHASEDSAASWNPITAEPGPPLRFEGHTDAGESISIAHVHWRHQTGGRLDADVWEVRYLSAFPALPHPPEEQYVAVRLTPTPLAIPEVRNLVRSWTGALAPPPSEEVEEPLPVVITTAVGEGRLSLTFSWEEVDLAGARCTLRVPHASLGISVEAEARKADQFDLMRAIDDAVADALMVLSFLSRRYVRWTGMYCSSHWRSQNPAYYSEAAIERTVHGSRPFEHRAPIVNPHRMKPEDLADVVARFSELPAKESISAAITYGIHVEDAPTVETAFTSAFTCLESLVTGLDNSGKLLSDSRFKVVRRRLIESLGEAAAENELPPATVEAMTKKLPELQRAPIVERACRVLQGHSVRWDDLWPMGVTLPEALRYAFKRRNSFLHAGVAPDPLLARADSMRLRFLSERLIFSLIGGSEKWFDWRSFELVPWLRTVRESPFESEAASLS